MKNAHALPRTRRAFTFLEVMVVVVIVGILAAIVVPQFGSAQEEAKASALRSSIGSWRAAIGAYRTRSALSATNAFPTLATLTTAGSVLSGDMPMNPYNGLANVQTVTQAQANARTVVNETTVGWNYYVDNTASPPVAIFYANSDDSVESSDGVSRTANQL
jgi:general secretion pathway protein G